MCGQVTYVVTEELSDFGYCHCRSCRKASGSAFGANAGIKRHAYQLSDPKGYVKEFESSPGKFRAFCSNCGSGLYAYLATTADLIRIRLGSLDSNFTKTAKAHTFVSDKATWDHIVDSLPQFETWASPDVLQQVGSKQKFEKD